MKYLKSSLKDLKEVFEKIITIRYIAEPLASFDIYCPATQARNFMDLKDYDIIGLRKDGLVIGYARKTDLLEKQLGDYLIPFDEKEKLPDTTPLLEVLESFRRLDRVFVIILGEIGGIVTRGDLQKAPVRMWLFGLISLIEMQLLRIIRRYYEDRWENLISEKRLKKANELLEKRKVRNEAIDLADCLQFCDKRDIVLESKELQEKLGFESKNQCESLLRELEELRNNLAHGQDIITGNWPEIIDLAKGAEDLLQKCEGF